MGYYIRTTESYFSICDKELPKFFELVAKLMSDETLSKVSGTYYTGSQTKVGWYRWVDTEEVRKATTIEDVFKAWRYELTPLTPDIYDNGETVLNYLLTIQGGESKMGDEERFFAAIAPVVCSDSYVLCSGEDGSEWKWLWRDGKFYSQDVLYKKISYDFPKEIL